MQIAIEVAAVVEEEAKLRGLSVTEFVQQLLEFGFRTTRENGALQNAVERIHALRQSEKPRPLQG